MSFACGGWQNSSETMQGQSRKSIRALAKSALFHLVFGWVGFSMAWTKVDQTGAMKLRVCFGSMLCRFFARAMNGTWNKGRIWPQVKGHCPHCCSISLSVLLGSYGVLRASATKLLLQCLGSYGQISAWCISWLKFHMHDFSFGDMKHGTMEQGSPNKIAD